MLGLIVGLAFMTADLPELSAAGKARVQYRQALRGVGLDPEANVRLALWCEAHGLVVERDTLLARALLGDPEDATARGLLGMVRNGGAWRAADAAEEGGLRAGLLAEYDARREGLPATPRAHWDIAVWCEARGLGPEALAHYTAVTRLDPNHAEAWERLGYRKVGDRWLTEEQIAAEEADARDRADAYREWRPRLASWKHELNDPDPARREEAGQRLDEVADPRAVPAIHKVFARGSIGEQGWAVRVLGHIDSGEAARELALAAVSAHSERVRGAAIERLRRRDPRLFVGLLINLLGQPVRYAVRPVAGPWSEGVLETEGSNYILDRVYEAGAGPDPSSPAGRSATAAPSAGALLARAKREAEAAEQRLEQDVRRIDRFNARLEEANQRVAQVLSRVTGKDLGPDQGAWVSWWSDQVGYPYVPPPPAPKPVTVQRVSAPLPIQIQPKPTVLPISTRPRSCFAAGTPVRTSRGVRPIESLRLGDRVLTQDAATGALSFQPILAAIHNPPQPTLRIELEEGETLVTTRVHRFWRPGAGWTMARELLAGDAVRTASGLARVRSVTPDAVQPVFNLDVAIHHDFFVGRSSVLAHDNTPAPPTPRPFDAVPESLPARGRSAREE